MTDLDYDKALEKISKQTGLEERKIEEGLTHDEVIKVAENISETETRFLDEENELYGYSIMNVHRNEFLQELGSEKGGDREVFDTAKEAIVFVLNQIENKVVEPENVSHLRLVTVRLDNENDDFLAEAIGDFKEPLNEHDGRVPRERKEELVENLIDQ